MKLLLIIAIGALFYFEFKRDKSLLIEYYYDGPYPEEIAKGLDYWTTNRLAFKKTESILYGVSTPQLSKSETLLTCFFVLLTVFFISQIVHVIVEKPMREKSRRFVFNSLK